MAPARLTITGRHLILVLLFLTLAGIQAKAPTCTIYRGKNIKGVGQDQGNAMNT